MWRFWRWVERRGLHRVFYFLAVPLFFSVLSAKRRGRREIPIKGGELTETNRGGTWGGFTLGVTDRWERFERRLFMHTGVVRCICLGRCLVRSLCFASLCVIFRRCETMRLRWGMRARECPWGTIHTAVRVEIPTYFVEELAVC